MGMALIETILSAQAGIQNPKLREFCAFPPARDRGKNGFVPSGSAIPHMGTDKKPVGFLIATDY